MFFYKYVFRKVTLNSIINLKRNLQVTVLGAASEIGQTVSLMFRAEPAITKLVVHDTREETPGVIMDLSHIPSASTLKGYHGEDTLNRALKDSDFVIAVGNSSAQLNKKSWFKQNTDFLKLVSSKIAKNSPMPFLGIAVEPINVLLPMVAEVMKNQGELNAQKLFGVTTIDTLRAISMYASINHVNPMACFVPVIGGHSEKTTIPLLSQARPTNNMSEQAIIEFTTKLRKYDDIATQLKEVYSPTGSVAYSILLFTRNIMNAIAGNPCQVNAFIENNDFGTSYFSGIVNIDKYGIKNMQRYNNISPYECHLLEQTVEQLRKDVSIGKKVLELA